MTSTEIMEIEEDVINLRKRLRDMQHRTGNIRNEDRDYAATLWHNLLLLLPRIQQSAEALQERFNLN